MKFRYLAFVVLMGLMSLVACAEENEAYRNVLVGDFEGAGVKGQLSWERRSDGLDIIYFSPSLRRKFNYFVPKFDECSSMVIYEIPRTRQVAIDGSCSSRGGQIYTNIFQWKTEVSNWCLVREITGERANDPSGRPAIANSVSHKVGCILLGQPTP